MKHFLHFHAAAAVALVGTVLLAGCAAPAPAPASEKPSASEPPYRPVASVREIMNSVIDPSVDVVWNAVKTVIERGRPTEHAPTTDEEWAEVRRNALVVAEAPNLLMMHTRPIAPPGAGSNAPGVELPPEEIRALIDKNPEAWDLFAQQLQDAMKPALAAIDKKDAQALLDAGDEIDTACESCHTTFWFPKATAATH